MDCSVSTCKDKVDRDVVDRNEACSCTACGCPEEEYSFLVEDHMQREQTIPFGGANVERLLEEEDDPDDATSDEKGDDRTATPSVTADHLTSVKRGVARFRINAQSSAETDGHYPADKAAST